MYSTPRLNRDRPCANRQFSTASGRHAREPPDPTQTPDPVPTRDEVNEVVKLYRETLDHLSKEHYARSAVRNRNSHRDAAMLLRRTNKWLNTTKRLGPVPGVQVGDTFQFRAELYVIGLHRQFQKGIDYMKKGGIILATSIVATSRYANYIKSNDILIYSGEGGNPRVRSQQLIKDQVLEHGNLALKNSREAGTPVRVVRKQNCKSSKLLALLGTKKNIGTNTTYVYDGLYLVEKFWQERGEFGKLVFKFQLRRMAGQPCITVRQGFLHKPKRLATRKEDRLVNDVSGGKEKVTIAVVNSVDDERPSPFIYVANMLVNNQSMLSGCDCSGNCSDFVDCSCKKRNRQVFPYDDPKGLVKKKPCIYESGLSCKCSDSCINRVSQLGIRFQLEVFRIEYKGWGVRSRSYIRSGSFVCEYIGEILQFKEAEQRVGIDEFRFHVGDSSSEDARHQDGGFIIDAAQYGNVARFINHSCSPNLNVQQVVYDHKDSRMPRIMLFAIKDIPPFQELTYDYKHRLGRLRNCMSRNMKAKNCMCGSPNCVGKFY